MLKSLELNGFKSFAKKSELEFGSSVTAIVGPNGSGKSNVVEAFRFVLGEQSIKSMRGKSGGDLIFKGSKTIAKLNRAKVSIVFDNRKKVFKLGDGSEENNLNVDFDDIEISREVFSDGNNKYSINGTEVRLKDVHELLASVHIGSSGHHIISQGQADKVLSSNSRDRRAMIEDALGLKVYQIKIKDAEKKIEKTEQNIKEVESLRREIAPHLRYLRKQVEKIKQTEDLRVSLGGLYREYLAKQNHILSKEYDELIHEQTTLSDELLRIDTMLETFGREEQFRPDSKLVEEIKSKENASSSLREKKDELSRSIARLEVLIEMSSKKEEKQESQTISVERGDFETFVRDMNVFIDQSLKSDDTASIKILLERMRQSLFSIQKNLSLSASSSSSSRGGEDTSAMKEDLEKLRREMSEVMETIENHQKDIKDIQVSIENLRTHFYESQRERFEIEKKRAGLVLQQELIQERIGRVREGRTSFEEEIREGVVLVGKEILSYGDVPAQGEVDRSRAEELRREIERAKIKLEEAGAGGGEEALKEYDEVSSRDQFLEKELHDLETALGTLKTLILDLKQTLDGEFQNGIKKINKEFEEFFKVMFGGGTASLSVVKKQIRRRANDEEESEEIPPEGEQEEGVEIDVSLPHKKVRELTMLSGGERSLTSIALLFAMSQVNPPPFLVLDETDAALDEANSRRYGDMIERLSHFSELIVVTHNRETMSRAKTLYGVTVGSDGSSKLLSIKFGEAEQYAK